MAPAFQFLRLGEPLAFAIHHQLCVVDESDSLRLGKLLGSLSYKVDVRTLIQNQPCGVDRITQALDAGDSAGTQVGAIHEQGVHLNAAIARKEAAEPRVEGIVIFKNSDCLFDGVESLGSGVEQRIPGRESLGHAVLVSLHHVVRDIPGAAVDQKNRRSWHLFILAASGGGEICNRGGGIDEQGEPNDLVSRGKAVNPRCGTP